MGDFSQSMLGVVVLPSNMAQSLSDEEFTRIQEQIIELRTLNYELEGQNQRQQAEIKSLQDKLLSQEKELQKSQKIINKSKNKKEYSLLLDENEGLQRQFQSQEENFRLQNQTLLLEITRLCEENDALKKDYEKLHKTGSLESGSNDSEIIRLRAENSALQKSLANAQERHEQELNALQAKLQPASENEDNLSTTRTTQSDTMDSLAEIIHTAEDDAKLEPSNQHGNNLTDKLQHVLNEEFDKLSHKIKNIQNEQTEKEENVNGESPSDLEAVDDIVEETTCEGGEDKDNVDNVDGELQGVKDRLIEVLSPMVSLSAENSQVNGSNKPNKELLQQSETKVASLEKQLKEMSGLQLRLDTELEEKHLLQQQLQQREESSQREISQQKDDISKMTDKLKKKQESYLQLQEEKEKSYSGSKKSLDDLKNKKDNEIRILAEQITKLQEEMGTANQRYFELQEESSQSIKELQNSIVNHQSKASTNAEETEFLVAQIRQEKDAISKEMEGLNKKLLMNIQEAEEAADLISRLEEKLQSSATRYLEINSVVDQLREQSKEQQNAIDELIEQVQQLTEERDKLALSYDETSKLAEKRKSTLDQMAIERQDVDRIHREQVEKINEEHKKTVAELIEQLTGEKKLRKEVDDLQQKIVDLKTRLQASDEKCSWFERTLTRTEETANAEREQNKKITEDLIEKHNQDMATLNEDKEKQFEEMTSQIEELNAKTEQEAEQHSKEIEEYDEKIAQLTQELKDKQVENRIAGKKGDQLVKDLKRQYKLERKRADQLQQKLQEALSENRAKQNFDELFSSPISLQRRNSGDSSILSPNRSDIDSPDIRPPSPSSSISGLLSEDTTDLIERLADVQSEKWLLEEKVRHLEETGGALADDLVQKSHIIQSYAMKTKIGAINETPKSPSISALKEKMKSSLNIGRNKADTKKIQIMLEETLMKNVQLQEDIDRLSKQLEKYTKNENKETRSSSIATATMDTSKDVMTQESLTNSDDINTDAPSTQEDQTTLES